MDYFNKEKECTFWQKLFPVMNKIWSKIDYIQNTPYQIKKIAVKDCYESYRINLKKVKNTKIPFKLKFRTRKDDKQTIFIPKQAVTNIGIYYSISGKLKMKEREFINLMDGDCRLTKEYNRYYLCIPCRFKNNITISENQGSDIVGIDPGVRTFCTYFSGNGHFGKIGEHGFTKIMRLCITMDKLISKISQEKNNKRRQSYIKALKNIKYKKNNLVLELQNKCALYFAKNYRVVCFPSFEVSEMVRKRNRKLLSKTARNMLNYNFYKFNQ